MLRFALLFIPVVMLAAPAEAQSRRELAARLDAVEARLAEMEERFLAGDPVADTLLSRVDALEREQRALTGEIERLNFENRRMREELERLGADVEDLFSGAAAGAGPAALEPGGGPEISVAAETGGEDVAVVDPDDPYAADRAAITQPLRLPGQRSGTSSAARTSRNAAGSAPVNAAAAGTTSAAPVDPETLFREGRSQLLDGDFGGAQESFAEFTDAHGDHDLAGEALYWLGETHFVQGAFQEAADSYLASLQTDRRGDKAPDALVRLAASLAAMGQTSEACNVLADFDDEFPDADAEARRKAGREAARANCS